MDADAPQGVLDVDPLDLHIEDIVTRGFPLGLVGRLATILKGSAYATAAVMVGFVTVLLFYVTRDFSQTPMFAVAFISGAFVVLLGLTTFLFLVMGVANIAAGLFGRMPIGLRMLNEHYETL